MNEEIKNNIRAAFVSAIGECDVNDESASRGIDAACNEAMSVIGRLAADLEISVAGCICRAEERDSARAQAENFKRRLIETEDQRAEMHRRMVQAECDRERTYRENRILTQLWCALREKVKALPKSDMTIGGWHNLQDFVKNQSHTDGLASNPRGLPAREAGSASTELLGADVLPDGKP